MFTCDTRTGVLSVKPSLLNGGSQSPWVGVPAPPPHVHGPRARGPGAPSPSAWSTEALCFRRWRRPRPQEEPKWREPCRWPFRGDLVPTSSAHDHPDKHPERSRGDTAKAPLAEDLFSVSYSASNFKWAFVPWEAALWPEQSSVMMTRLHFWQRRGSPPSTTHFLSIRSGGSAPAAGIGGFTCPPSQWSRRTSQLFPGTENPVVTRRRAVWFSRRSFNLGHIWPYDLPLNIPRW